MNQLYVNIQERKSSIRKRKTDDIKYKICSQQGTCPLKKTVLQSEVQGTA